MNKKKGVAYVAGALFAMVGVLMVTRLDFIFGRAEYEGFSGLAEGFGRLIYGSGLAVVGLIFLALGLLQKPERDDQKVTNWDIPPIIFLLIGLGCVLYAYFSYVSGNITWWSEMVIFPSAAVGAVFLGLGFAGLFNKRAR